MKLTKKEILQKIEQLEEEGNFSEHATPIMFNKVQKVNGKYKYINHNPFYLIAHGIFRGLLAIFKYPLNYFAFKLKIVGKENLKGLKNGVVTINHVHELDCLIPMQALKGKKLYITVGEFNNFKNALGGALRCWGTLPLASSMDAQKNFWRASAKLLQKKNRFILFYPETSMWSNYTKPRPFSNGAYHMAVKNDVPIVPMFITYNKTGKFNRQGIEECTLTAHIMPPIFKDQNKTDKDNIIALRDKNFDMCKELYQKTYGIPLKYNTEVK